MGEALRISEEFDTPVILRSSTRVSHSMSLVEIKPRGEGQREWGSSKIPRNSSCCPPWQEGVTR